MKSSIDYLISLFPEKYRDMILKCDYSLLPVFMEDEVKDQKLAYYLSMIANLEDTPKFHNLAASIYHFHFNWIEGAYSMAFFHYWRMLELEDFSNYISLKEFLTMIREPDFDIIPQENIEFLRTRVAELECEENN